MDRNKRQVARASKCILCKYHHSFEKVPDGWYCGKHVRYACRKSMERKDYSVLRKSGK